MPSELSSHLEEFAKQEGISFPLDPLDIRLIENEISSLGIEFDDDQLKSCVCIEDILKLCNSSTAA